MRADVFRPKTPITHIHSPTDHLTLRRMKAPSSLFFLSPTCYRVRAKARRGVKDR